MAGLGYAIAGAVGGLGEEIVNQAEKRREEQLLRLKRKWQQQDMQQERGWDVEDRDLAYERDLEAEERGYRREDQVARRDRGWDVEDRDLEYGREDRSIRRGAEALRGLGARGDRPAGSDPIDEILDKYEGAGDYDTLYGHSQREGGKFAGTRVTDMTIGEALEFANPSGDYGQWVKANNPKGEVATPMGRYQVVGTTLRKAAEELGYDMDTRLTPGVQREIRDHLARKRISGPRTQEAKRAALRNEWDGLNKAPDEEVDQIIAHLERTPERGREQPAPGDDAYYAAADPNLPSDTRQTITEGLGFGADKQDILKNQVWADMDGDGREERVGYNERTGQYEEVLGPDGQPLRNPVAADRRDVKLTRSDEIMIEDRIKGRYERDVDYRELDAVKRKTLEILRADPSLTNDEAVANAVDDMLYEVEITNDPWGPLNKTTEKKLVTRNDPEWDPSAEFTGRFASDEEAPPSGGLGAGAPRRENAPEARPRPPSGTAAAAEPAEEPEVLPMPSDPRDLVVNKVYPHPDDPTIAIRWTGKEFVEVR